MGTRSAARRRALSVLVAATLLSGVAAAMAPPAFADPNTWVVHSGGDDTNSCISEFSACATIAAALAKASPGGIIEVGAGTFTDPVTISMPVSLQPINASDVGTITGGVSVVDGTDNVTIDGLDFGGTQTAISAGPTNALTLTNNTFALTGNSGAAIVLAVPDQADVLNATLGGNTGTVGTGMRTIAEIGAGTIAVNSTGTPNTITSSSAGLTVDVPASIHTGATATPFAGTADVGGLDVPAARYDVRITGTSGLTASEVDLEYNGVGVSLVGTASAGDAITGSFGAFPPGSLDSAPSLSLAAAVDALPGTLHVVTALDEVAEQSGDTVLNTIASTADDVEVITNQLPVAGDDSTTVSAAHSTDIDLASKTSDADNDPLTYSVVTDGAKGHVTFSGSTATYTPNGTPTGTDTFQYKVNDGTDDSNTATVTVTFNNAPTASADAVTIAATHATDINLSSNTTDGDNDPLTYSVVTDGAKGHVTFSGSTATYTPNGAPTGTDTFQYKVNDGTDDSNTATVTVTFNKVPTAASQIVTMASRHVATITLHGADADGGAGALTYAPVQPKRGTIAPTSAPNVWKYTPNAGFVGTDSFRFTTADGFDTSQPATVTLKVHVNRAPVINTPLTVDVAFNGSRPITFSATDPDGDALSYSVLQHPTHGSLTGKGRARTYTPDRGFAGMDSFTFQARDRFGGVTKATVEITVAKAAASIVAVRFSPTHPTTGQVVKAAVTVSTPGTATGGRIELREGTKTYSAKVTGKKATVVLGRLRAGTHNFTVRFGGTSTTTQSTQVSASPLKVSKISKVTSTLRVSSSPQQLTTTSHGTAIITVTAAHAHVDGALVTIKQGSRTLGTGTVKGGVAKIALPNLSLGQHNLTVSYAGTSTATAATQTWIVRVALG